MCCWRTCWDPVDPLHVEAPQLSDRSALEHLSRVRIRLLVRILFRNDPLDAFRSVFLLPELDELQSSLDILGDGLLGYDMLACLPALLDHLWLGRDGQREDGYGDVGAGEQVVQDLGRVLGVDLDLGGRGEGQLRSGLLDRRSGRLGA